MQDICMLNPMSPPLPPAGWYGDPTTADQLRYWDGSAWTGHVAPLARSPARVVAHRRNIYGHDMLYIELNDGTSVGHINLDTENTVIERPELTDECTRAIAAWRSEHLAARAASDAPPAPSTGAPVAATEPGWRDLAANRPGEALRRKAAEVRRQAPVKAFLARLLGIKTEERAWRIGADGEEEVARQLARLGGGWKVIHSVVLNDNGTDIDHVVIGPGGVYTLNTKNHAGSKVTVYDKAVLVNGQKTPYLPKSRTEARRACERLSAACRFPVDVQPVVVVICRELRVMGRPDDVHVVGRRDLRRWMERRPTVLRPDAVDRIYGAARRDSTWRG